MCNAYEKGRKDGIKECIEIVKFYANQYDGIYWAIRDNKDEGGTQPYGIITEPTDALLVKETIDKANDEEQYFTLLTFDCPFNIEWEFNTITQCREV